MTGRNVHKTGALFHRDEITGVKRDVEIITLASERMGCNRPRQLTALHLGQDFVPLNLAIRQNLLKEGLRNKELFTCLRQALLANRTYFDDAIEFVLRITDRAVAGNCPGCCRPDDDIYPLKSWQTCRKNREADPNSSRGMVMIFNLGFRQGCATR